MTIDMTRMGVALWHLTHGRKASVEEEEGVVLGRAGKRVIRSPLPSQSKAAHLACLAASGGGKSVLIAFALVQEIAGVA